MAVRKLGYTEASVARFLGVEVCAREAPPYRDTGGEHFVSCHFADTLSLQPVKLS